jgi:pimeloyl-ACP methyl ester carboxylesterase
VDDVRRLRTDVDVTDCGLPGLTRLAAEVVWSPEHLADERTVLVCFPGGGMNRRYFDIPVPGYSMAAYLADRGHLVVLMDHPGLGDSDVPDDPWQLTPRAVAEIDAYAVAQLGATLAAGGVAPDLPAAPAGLPVRTIGVGHSMGAMLVAGQQAAAKPYEGLALLGHSGYGLPQVLTPAELAYAGRPEELREAIEGLTRARFGRPLTGSATSVSEWLTGDGVPDEVIAAMSVTSAPLLTMSGLTSMIPGSLEPEMASITVPVLVAVGEHDIVGPTDRLADDLPAAQPVTVAVIPGASHNHNVAPTRQLLWDALADWLVSVGA